mmetsp:Transcript_93992/g.303581  ORF Transcript_93992/g.303581 Transcript_93992/m.303581 type:complete len:388 (-) Transcript_93992:15-1178(-)
MAPVGTGVNTAGSPLRFGVLGAASISASAIIGPCRKSPQEAVITALAARDRARAEEHCRQHKLTECKVFDSYQSLLDHADIDAVYVPSPNGLHYEWTMKALAAGYHVLCEKPFASNAEEARAMVQAARAKGLVLMEAAHWFYHPYRQRMQEIVASGKLGKLQGVYANFFFPGKPGLPPETKTGTSAIRYDTGLAGGCMMDCGWYVLSCIRTLVNGEEPEVEWAQAQRWAHNGEIDEGMKAGLSFPRSGVTGTAVCSYVGDGSDGFVQKTWPGSSAPTGGAKGVRHPLGPMRWDAEVTGSEAVLHAVNFGVPHAGNRLVVKRRSDGAELLSESVDSGGYATYDLMVLAFCSHVRQVRAGWVKDTEAFANTGLEPIRQMEVIDRIYALA